jgi:sugar (pentulose or hexulose) kinase
MPTTPDDLLLAIDNGTQSVRALLFDLQGHLVAKAQHHFDDYLSPQPGWHEHDVDAFWQAAAGVCQRLWAAHPKLKPAVRGVAVTTQRGTVLAMGRDGRPLHPAITWLDQRKASRLPAIGLGWRAAFKLARVTGTIDYFQREAEVNWFSQHAPALWENTHKFVLLSGYLNWRLTGRHADSVGSQVAYLPFDYKRHAWAAPRDWKWQALAVRPDQLPELVPVGETLGVVTPEAAEATGIPAGLPVIAAAADKACEILGAGALQPHIGALSYGTTATINVTLPRYIEATPLLPAYPAALPAHYSSEVSIFRGYWMVHWFKENFGELEKRAAAQGGGTPEALFDALVGTVPPGSLGLMLQPYWTPGVRSPGPDAKGAVIGFGDVHNRAHLYRAILEGIAYGLRDGKERIEKRAKLTLTELRVSGGGSQSDAAMQLTADIFKLPAARPHLYETSGLGAAIDCAVGLGLHPDFASAVAAMTRPGRVFAPDPQNVAIYDALYDKVYRRMYAQLAPLYAEIQRITGYPKLD